MARDIAAMRSADMPALLYAAMLTGLDIFAYRLYIRADITTLGPLIRRQRPCAHAGCLPLVYADDEPAVDFQVRSAPRRAANVKCHDTSAEIEALVRPRCWPGHRQQPPF